MGTYSGNKVQRSIARGWRLGEADRIGTYMYCNFRRFTLHHFSSLRRRLVKARVISSLVTICNSRLKENEKNKLGSVSGNYR